MFSTDLSTRSCGRAVVASRGELDLADATVEEVPGGAGHLLERALSAAV